MDMSTLPDTVPGTEHWAQKAPGVDLFLWRKTAPEGASKGTIIFVHGSSMASQPTFDLQVEGRPYSSVMDWFAVQGYDTWCVDLEGYGRSTKTRDITSNIADGADDLCVATDHIIALTGQTRFFFYGISSGALRAAAFAERHPERVAKIALDAFVWTGEGSPTLEERRKRLDEFRTMKRRPMNKEFVYSIFNRDHPGTAEDRVIDAFADAICALDQSMPTGTYVDMCSKLPLTDPAKLTMPVIIMRGEYDGIASMEDLLSFFAKLPHPAKQFSVMQGISHASFQQKNYLMVYHILRAFFEQPDALYTGG